MEQQHGTKIQRSYEAVNFLVRMTQSQVRKMSRFTTSKGVTHHNLSGGNQLLGRQLNTSQTPAIRLFAS